MSYADFTLSEIKSQFRLKLDESRNFFAAIPAIAISPLLQETLAESISLAVAISTEKARSEMIIVPVLMEVRRQLKKQISLFSGVEFNVDGEQGLKGVCDYLLSLSAEQLTVEAPVLAVVEAKNDNIKAGLGQCLAEMIGARVFNEQRGKPLDTIFGVVTTGSLWKFMKMEADTAYIDLREYHIHEVERIVGILVDMIRSALV
jgi:hypothetical protein